MKLVVIAQLCVVAAVIAFPSLLWREPVEAATAGPSGEEQSRMLDKQLEGGEQK